MAPPPAPDPDPAESASGRRPPNLVGIGASAGGILALREFFAEVPEESGIAFVVIMHLSPDHESQLAEVLQHDVRIPVRQVRDRTRIEADHVYVIPPNRSLTLADGHLELAEFTERRGHRAPIDLFFRTLAESYPDGAGVLLSGSGTDGVVGLKALKETGGLIMAQLPEEAEYDTMPRALIATGLVDFVLPARELGAKAVELRSPRARWTPPARPEELSRDDAAVLHRALSTLRVRTGHDFAGYKKSTVLRRIERRMQIVQVDSLSDYLDLLRGSATEPQALLKDLLISVTSFFRDAEAFAALRQRVIPELIEGRSSGDEVRVWVAGCATGEEAYSIAMLLAEHASTIADAPKIQVFATDLDEEAIAFAREGLYPDAIAADVGDDRLRRFFNREGVYFRVRKELRDLVLFSRHNLLRDPPFSRVGLVSVRNLLIYLERELQERLFSLLAYALRPGGFLFLGNSEGVPEGGPFRPVDKQNRIFRRVAAPHGPPERLPHLPLSAEALTAERSWHRPISGQQAAADRELHRQALELHAPPSILVRADHVLVHVSETASRYLEFPAGSPTANLLRVVRSELRIELRAALYQALEMGEATRTEWVAMEIGGVPRRVQIHVSPVHGGDEPRHALVVFLESAPRAKEAHVAPDVRSARRMDEAEGEIATLQARLQEVIETSESRQEELRASNEELQSINEEYKSTLEELETSKEELQSINEELKTVNDQLRIKVEELARARDDLHNLMAATQMPTLFVDRSLRIKRFTPALTEIFNVMPVDEDRPLSHITHTLRYDRLAADCEEVLRTREPAEREVDDTEGRNWLVRIIPYRTDDDRIQGIVATFTDISRIRQAQEHLRESEQRFRALIEAAAEMVWTTDPTGAMTGGSRSWQAFTGQRAEEASGWGWLDVVHPDDRESARRAWDQAVERQAVLETQYRVRRAGSDEWRTTAVRAVPLLNPDGTVREWVGMNSDVTQRAEAEAALRQAKESAEKAAAAKSQFLSTMSHELRTPLTAVIGMSDLLEMEVVGPMIPAQKAMLQRVQACSWHLVAIIEEVLTYSRVDAGRERPNPSEFDVAEILGDVTEMLRLEAEQKELELTLRGADEPALAVTDANKVRQIMTNLIGNAVKFTDSGSVEIELHRSDDELVLEIRDTGPGIPPDHLEAVFEAFVQVDGTTTREKGGTGLGLTVSQRLTRLLGGEISVESGVGEGTTFRLRLPRTLPEKAAGA
jgi:two-component system, chemotaxis family, CheB/CheR fusion protein